MELEATAGEKMWFFQIPEEVRDMIFVYFSIAELVAIERSSKDWKLEIARVLASKTALGLLGPKPKGPKVRFNDLCNIKSHQIYEKSIVKLNSHKLKTSQIDVPKFVKRFPNLKAFNYGLDNEDNEGFSAAFRSILEDKDCPLEHVATLKYSSYVLPPEYESRITCLHSMPYFPGMINLKYFSGRHHSENLRKMLDNGLRGLTAATDKQGVFEVLRQHDSQLEHLAFPSAGFNPWSPHLLLIRGGHRITTLETFVDTAENFVAMLKAFPNLEELAVRGDALTDLLRSMANGHNLLENIDLSKIRFLSLNKALGSKVDAKPLLRPMTSLKEVVGMPRKLRHDYPKINFAKVRQLPRKLV